METKHIEILLMTLFFICCLVVAQISHAALPPGAESVKSADDAPSSVMGFKSWKSNRVEMASRDLAEFRQQQRGQTGDQVTSVKGLAMDPGEAIRQFEFNLEIAKGLTIHDYFALYLKDKSAAELTEIVKMLSPEELSALLIAYRQQLFEPEMVEKSPVDSAAVPTPVN